MYLVMWLLLFLAATLCGYLWSRDQRRRAVEQAYQNIREEIRRERESGEETISVWRFQ